MKTQGRKKAVVREGELTVDYGHALFKCEYRFIWGTSQVAQW